MLCRLAAVFSATLLFAGCASAAPPLLPKQAEAWAEVQQLMAMITKAYGLRGVTMQLTDGYKQGEIATVRENTVFVAQRLMDYPQWQRDKIIAHEAAHLINGDSHRMRQGWSSRAEALTMLRGLEVEADVKVVEILQRVRGYTECKALLHLLTFKQGQAKALADGRLTAWPEGHWPPSEEYDKILARFPAHQPWTGQCPK